MKLWCSVRAFCSTGIDFVYPAACLWCRRPSDSVPEHSAEKRICSECLQQLIPEVRDRCRRCSAPVGAHLDTTQGCVHCRTDPYAFVRAVSVGTYQDALKQAVLRCKHAPGTALTNLLAEQLWTLEQSTLESFGADVVIPIPHHWSDRIRRPNLPVETLSQRLGEFLKLRVERHILQKVKRTPRQTSLSSTDRRSNLRGAFRVSQRSELEGSVVLLVDDVLTTGTTAHRAARTLLQAGTGRVFVAVVARGIGA